MLTKFYLARVFTFFGVFKFRIVHHEKKLHIGFLIVGLLVCASSVFCQRKRVKAKRIDKVFMDFDYGIYSSQLIVTSDYRWEASLKERNRWKHGISSFYQVSVGKTIKKTIFFQQDSRLMN